METNGLVEEQKAPVPTQGPAIWDLVQKDFQYRDHVGREKYGTPLQPHNGRDALTDLYQELLDACVYTRQVIYERTHPLIDTVYVDLDGVLVNFVGGALAAHGAGIDRLITGEWYIHKWLGITAQEFWAPVRGHDFWRNLEWLPDGWDILNEVMAKVPKNHIWLLSTHSDDEGSCSGKYAWVRKYLPGLRRKLILTPSKAPMARPGSFLIDDCDANVEAFRKAGGEAMLVPRPWNSGHAYSRPGLPARTVAMKLAQIALRLKEEKVAA